MNIPCNEEEALQRLLAINWTVTRSGSKSDVALVREYLRRAAQWVKTLKTTEHWPFSDFGCLIDPEVRASPEVAHQFQAVLRPFSLWPTITKSCLWYLHWVALKRNKPEALAAYNLEEPYEPLIRLYERSGRFYTEHGFINIDTVGIPAKVRGWQAYDTTTPIVALDDDTLDRLDAEDFST